MIRLTALSILTFLPVSALALDLAMPQGSTLAVDKITEAGSYALPEGPFADGALSTQQITGYVSRQVWHLADATLSTDQLIDPLRAQIKAAGFAVLLDCDAASCGGFDFRFATEVLPAPDMFVDLIDYRFLSATRDTDEGREALSVLVSRTDTTGIMQLIAVQPSTGSSTLPLAKPVGGQPFVPTSVANPQMPSEFIKALEVGGHVILNDLAFETGSSNLADQPFSSLEALATYLIANPDIRLALVGHTDSVGGLDGNMSLSQKRALAVRTRLIETHSVPASQLEANGVGYLAPLASNLTEAGRTANRRVEAVVLTK